MIRLKLKEVLRKKGMTQKELSEISGINETTISFMSRDTSSVINKENLAKIMKALDIQDISEIIEYTPE